MRKLAEYILRKVWLDGFFRGLLHNLRNTKKLVFWHFKRHFGRVDRAIIERYFTEHKPRKLHIGCGGNSLSNWLNSDLFPTSDTILHIDATEPFPFAPNTFDFIFSEHMIEHISYAQGLTMLNECHRVLKNSGKIRISTPNLSFLIDLYNEKKSELQKDYIKWSTDTYNEAAPYYDDVFVINQYVRNWGHVFIYDEKTLRSSLVKTGFTNIVRCELNESESETLRNLENAKRMPKGFLKLESLTMEGTKSQNQSGGLPVTSARYQAPK